jgi:hypothetical protein
MCLQYMCIHSNNKNCAQFTVWTTLSLYYALVFNARVYICFW